MYNPVITFESKEKAIQQEACLSYPGKSKHIARSTAIHLTYQTEKGVIRVLKAFDFHARVIQHEVEHLFGVCKVGDDSYPDDREVEITKRRLSDAVAKINPRQ